MTKIWHAKAWLISATRQINPKNLLYPNCHNSSAVKICSTNIFYCNIFLLSQQSPGRRCLLGELTFPQENICNIHAIHNLLQHVTYYYYKNRPLDQLKLHHFLIVSDRFSVLSVAELFTTFSGRNFCHPEATVLLNLSRSFPVTPFRSRLPGFDMLRR